jgi:serine/threonine protein kinase
MVHRDLKPDNLLLHRLGSGQILGKVGDVGLCALVAGKACRQPPTVLWVAPEVERRVTNPTTKKLETGFTYSYATDVWSLGLSFASILFRPQGGSVESTEALNVSGLKYHRVIAGSEVREQEADLMASNIWWSKAWGVDGAEIRVAVAHMLLKCVAHANTQRIGVREIVFELERIMNL